MGSYYEYQAIWLLTGLLFSNQFNTNVQWSAGARYAVLHYEYGQLKGSSLFTPSWVEYDDPDDASHNAQAELTLSWRIKPHFELAVGASCQYLLRNTNPNNKERYCLPIVGMSFYRL